jgi:beta propeller repeat protein
MKTVLIALVGTVLLAGVVPATATDPSDTSNEATVDLKILSTSVEQIRVTDDPADQFDPAISGGRVAYTDARNQATDGFDVYFVDLDASPRQEVRVTPFSGGQDVEDIDGNYIVYKQTTGAEWDIWYYNVADGSYGTVTAAAGSQTNPAISGLRVVWQDSRNGNADIYTTLIGSGVEDAVTNVSGNQVNPAISGDWIVWQDGRDLTGSLYDIYARKPDGTEMSIATGPTNQTNPDVSGGVIVWEQAVAARDIYLWVGGSTYALTSDTAPQVRPRISGDHVVWEHDNGTDTDLYGCHWAIDANGVFSCPVFPVVVGEGDQFLHDVDGPNIAYTALTDDDGDGIGNLDIFVRRVLTQVACQDRPATIFVRDGVIVGGPFDGEPYAGVLDGTDGDDVMVGTDGNDYILGRGGNDTICAGPGRDALDGGMGNDVLDAGEDDDLLFGGLSHGADTLLGGPGNDLLNGWFGFDRLDGGSERDYCFLGEDYSDCEYRLP